MFLFYGQFCYLALICFLVFIVLEEEGHLFVKVVLFLLICEER